ncbi:MAG TPA: S24/S26 family peptidase [Capsulimonadaceae bacterium]|nr:S24/S26 family peptidase [Capsulimonadaceae bacterium]
MTRGASHGPRSASVVAKLGGLTHDPARLEALCALWKAAKSTVWLTLAGYSMAPTLPPGTRLKVTCGEPAEDNIAVGDILVVRDQGSLVIHRLVEIAESPKRYICKGDGNPHRDPPASEEMVVGRVVETRLPGALTRLRKRVGHFLRERKRAAAAKPQGSH